jgi:hypothetical protein
VFPGVGATPTVYTYSFDVYPAQVDETTKSDAVVAVIQLSDSIGTLWGVQFELSWDTSRGLLGVFLSEDTEFPDGGESFHQTPATPLPLATWTRVTLALTVGANNVPQTASLFYNGSVVATGTMHPTTTNGTVDFLLGYSYVGPGNGVWSLLYDNVTFSAK